MVNKRQSKSFIAKMLYLCKQIHNKMNISKKLLSLIALALVTLPCIAQTHGTVYVFGIGDSMKDSTVFFTHVQRVDNANLQKRTGFLLDRADFSQQLKKYFATSLNDKNRLCIIYYFKKEKEAIKKLQKVRSNYLDDGMLVKYIDQEAFSFTPIENAVYEKSTEEEPANQNDTME